MKLIINLTDIKEKVSSKANLLLNWIHKIYSSDEIVPQIVKFLEK
jgi:hypothetical protein